ncbi:MAG: Ig-like domain-containing protein [Rhodospirillaceae bacterium]|nr:Ig-like domain-containing protein [Rhodospirillaceae bacterium]
MTDAAPPLPPKPPSPPDKEPGITKPLIIAGIGVVIVAAAVILSFTMQSPFNERGRPSSSRTVPGPTLPSFDVVRIDAKGNTVMAGRAAPGAVVIILDDDTEIGRATADQNGEWVFTPDRPLPAGAHQLSLKVETPGGPTLVSANVVVMSVPEQGGEVLIVEQARDGGKSRVLQGPDAPPELKTLTVDAVDYDSSGKISLGGKAEPGATVQVYLDNAFVGRALADSTGNWQLEPETKAAPGPHTLRVDQVGATDTVLARVEVPFTVDAPTTDAPGGSVTIVRGNSLWRIARRVYGEGTKYTVIYEANQANIKNPDLIYPGQVFQLPPEQRR